MSVRLSIQRVRVDAAVIYTCDDCGRGERGSSSVSLESVDYASALKRTWSTSYHMPYGWASYTRSRRDMHRCPTCKV
jgi:ribosomal protein L37AE/L43A